MIKYILYTVTFIIGCSLANDSFDYTWYETESEQMSRLDRLYGASPDTGAMNRNRTSKASQKGDRVTIVVNINSSATAYGKSDLSTSSTAQSELMKFFTVGLSGFKQKGQAFDNAKGKQSKTPTLDYSSSSSNVGEGTNQISNTMSTRLSGEVVDVLPNGQLLIAAISSNQVDGEKRSIMVTGRIDRKDLDVNSTILSEKIMNLEVAYKGRGEITDQRKRGILTRLVQKFKIF